ncbi:MAG TPA: biotin/lipoyl-containing protein, partial [Thermoanaerobaculia bacterium]|nr:biotin/lipoyl-containing protein [Thermoanaerobaculia bacterium]
MDLVILEGETERRVSIERAGSGFVVVVEGERYEIDHVSAGAQLSSLVVGGRQWEVSAQPEGDGRYRIAASGGEALVEVRDPLTHLARRSSGAARSDGKRAVTAYMPGRVVAVLVEQGQRVEAGAGIVVLEAMKMENEIRSEV